MRATNIQYVEKKTTQEWTPMFKIHYHTDSRNSHPLFSESQVLSGACPEVIMKPVST